MQLCRMTNEGSKITVNTFSANVKIHNAVSGITNNPNTKHTLYNFRNAAKASRNKILDAKQRAEADKANLFDIYSNRLATEKAAEIDENLRKLIYSEKTSLSELAGEIMSGKRARYREIALTAPSDEQIRMLQALQLRATSLTAAEISSVAETMADNHQALRSLAAIAEQSGIKVVIPASVEQTEENFAEVEEYLSSMINAVDAKSHNYVETEFFYDGDLDAGYFKVIVDAMDESGFIAEQEKPKARIEILNEAVKDAISKKDYEKSERIQKFIEENDARLLSSAERLDRDMTAAINGK